MSRNLEGIDARGRHCTKLLEYPLETVLDTVLRCAPPVNSGSNASTQHVLPFETESASDRFLHLASQRPRTSSSLCPARPAIKEPTLNHGNEVPELLQLHRSTRMAYDPSITEASSQTKYGIFPADALQILDSNATTPLPPIESSSRSKPSNKPELLSTEPARSDPFDSAFTISEVDIASDSALPQSNISCLGHHAARVRDSLE